MAFPRRTLEGLAKTIADLKQLIQNVTIPKGTIWWFHGRTTAPVGWVICDGTNETPNLIGRYPLGSTSDIGSEVSAGLPNITGVSGMFFAPPTEIGGRWEGALAYNAYIGWWVRGNNGDGGYPAYNFNIDARRSSEVYGNSDTVTPPSVKLLPCMKL